MNDSNASDPLVGSPEGLSQTVSEVRTFFERVGREVGKVFVGQDELVTTALIALVSGGHVLIEGVPGLGKTLFVKTLGRVIGCQFGRIQFTADLMPSDVTGAPIFDMKTQDFRFRPGPVFTQLLLADEINRSPAKTHAALLEIMQEARVTIDGVTHSVPAPFLVFATQNPLESEGTYSLPEAQLDRFMFKAMVGYPSEEEEARVLQMHSQKVDMDTYLSNEVANVSNSQTIQNLIQQVSKINVEPKLLQYINRIVRATRNWPTFHLGASPRAGLSLVQGARALAAFRGRDYAVPDDVAEIVLPALRHRVVLGAEAEVEGLGIDQELRTLLKSIEVPRT
ncbi:MAG: AAA family ATPase [Planctomycetota bacterium]|jgi:MoxR-like ATPase